MKPKVKEPIPKNRKPGLDSDSWTHFKKPDDTTRLPKKPIDDTPKTLKKPVDSSRALKTPVDSTPKTLKKPTKDTPRPLKKPADTPRTLKKTVEGNEETLLGFLDFYFYHKG